MKQPKGRQTARFVHTMFMTAIAAISAACGQDESPAGNGSENGANEVAVAISDAVIQEGNDGSRELTFTVGLGGGADGDVTVDFATSDVEAAAGDDYVAASGTVTILADSTSAELTVTVNGDTCFESDESLLVTLSNVSSNATLSDSSATGTITNDDQRRIISIADSEVVEGDSGESSMVFTVSLDTASCVPTTVTYTSSVVTADSSDFAVDSLGLTIPAGSTEVEAGVTIVGDLFYETDETLTASLEDLPNHIQAGDVEAFGTIRTDDLPPLSILPASVSEGDDGSRFLEFVVELAGVTNEVEIDFATVDGGATIADGDYGATSGTLVIPAGDLSATIQVEVFGDEQQEPNESFTVALSNLVGDAELLPAFSSASGTIFDDDTPVVEDPELTVSGGVGAEGDPDTFPAVFSFRLNVPTTNSRSST